MEFASKRINEFENTFKIVMIENVNVNWKYECTDSSTLYNIKMKTKQLRFKSLFNSKQMLEFDPPSFDSIETIARLKNRSSHFVILVLGMPAEESIHNSSISTKDLLYVNFKYLEATKKLKNQILNRKSCSNSIPSLMGNDLKGRFIVSSRQDRLKGTPEIYHEFSVDKNLMYKDESRTVDRAFMKDLIVMGQFDLKTIVAKRKEGGYEQIWLFDQHACSERINLEKILNNQTEKKSNITREEANMIACKSAIKFGDYMGIETQTEIIKSLSECDEPFHCAHGRPTCWLVAKLETEVP